MANRKILFALLFLCLSLTESGKFGRGGGSRGGSSWGKWGGSSSSSSSSWSKPSSSSSSWNKPSSSWSYPSSSSGLSGGSSSSSRNKPSSSWTYPSSSSGLSGTGSSSSSWSYPSSSSGLSGNKPSSSTGTLSAFENWSASNNYNKPSSTSGSHSYPTGGLSGSGSGSRYPTSSSGTHSYPSNNGLSGGSKYPANSGSSYNKPNYNSGTFSHGPAYVHVPHSYYTAPQHVYVSQYRDSGSRYGDLLTGLALYNMGRSHNHYHDHYYSDDYYRHRYNDNYYNSGNYNSGSYGGFNFGNNNNQQQSSYGKPKDEAVCSLNINDNGKIDSLKIPCEIVSTFTEGGKKVSTETHVNVVCTSNITTIPNPQVTTGNNATINITGAVNLNGTANATASPLNISTTSTTNSTINSTYTQTTTVVTGTHNWQQSIVNVTTCINQTFIDPLSVKGGPITSFDKMKCAVEIKTKDAHLSNPIDCKTLMDYAKMPEPKKESKPLLPTRQKLKSWLDNPPWWMSIFIAL